MIRAIKGIVEKMKILFLNTIIKYKPLPGASYSSAVSETLESLADTSESLDTLETLTDSSNINDTINKLLEAGIAGITVEKLLTALIASALSFLVVKVLLNFLDRYFMKSSLDATLKILIRGGLKALLIFVALIIVLGYLDIPVTSLVAVLSVIGLALSLAMQNFLSNVAGGLQLLVSQPFKIGDYVDIGGNAGTVVNMTLFYTKLDSVDTKLINLPNSSVVTQTIINYSTEEKRRLELKVSASYDVPVSRVLEVLKKLIDNHPLTLTDPPSWIHVNSYGDSSIQYIIRVWCMNKDYWDLYFDLLDRIKPLFDKEGVTIAYPHLDVQITKEAEN